jgi:hypothetical protein
VLYAFADSIPPGKTDDVRRFYAELCGARKADYDEIARRSGVTAEWYWLQTGSEGDLVVVVSSSDQQAFDTIMANPETDFDHWLREQIEEIFGFDPGKRQGIRNELLGMLRV